MFIKYTFSIPIVFVFVFYNVCIATSWAAPFCGAAEKGVLILDSKKAVLVCVTGQHDCDRLIHAGKCIAQQRNVQLQVLCVQPTSKGVNGDCDELEYLRQTSKEADAEMTVYFNDEAAYTAAAFACHVGAVHIVTGMAEEPVNGFIDVLHSLLPEIPISMVAKDKKVYNICPENMGCMPRLAYSF